jgi:hypothetical protein
VARLLLLLESGQAAELEELLCTRLQKQFAGVGQVAVQLMRAVQGDVFYRPDSPFPRPQLVLDFVTSPGCPLTTYLAELKVLLAGLPYSESSLALVMRERVYIDCGPQAFHYHYLMLRREDFSTADYMDYYSNFHCRFGFHTPAIEGYSQNDIDLVASAEIASELGLGFREVTSLSELKMPSIEGFLASPAMAELGGPAEEDELRFVDRDSSISFSSEVVFRLGDSEAVREAVFEQFLPA